jgi:hypothetical protein
MNETMVKTTDFIFLQCYSEIVNSQTTQKNPIEKLMLPLFLCVCGSIYKNYVFRFYFLFF